MSKPRWEQLIAAAEIEEAIAADLTSQLPTHGKVDPDLLRRLNDAAARGAALRALANQIAHGTKDQPHALSRR